MNTFKVLGRSATPRLKPLVSSCCTFSRSFTQQEPPFTSSQPPKHSPLNGDIPLRTRTPSSFGFAFDIDGVLLHVSMAIPGASQGIGWLQRRRIPYIFLTNGGGDSEHNRTAQLTNKLRLHKVGSEDNRLSPDNFVQSHTPFQDLVYGDFQGKDKTILVTGSDPAKAREIAEGYGFKNVVIPDDIVKRYPDIFPFNKHMTKDKLKKIQPLYKIAHTIEGIFVFNDPRDWAVDVQIICDLLMSEGGRLGTYSKKNGDASLPNHGWQQDGQPPLHFSNPDLFWSAAYHLPRFGQGAFQAALAGIWSDITKGKADLIRNVWGKPHESTYRYAEAKLHSYCNYLSRSRRGHGEPLQPLKRIYMIGDNPESDIRGANSFQSPRGTEWVSILVRTGVWSPERGEPSYQPRVIVDDVEAAIKWALKQEGWSENLIKSLQWKPTTAGEASDFDGMAEAGTTEEGIAEEGTPEEGTPEEGTADEGTVEDGTAEEGQPNPTQR